VSAPGRDGYDAGVKRLRRPTAALLCVYTALVVSGAPLPLAAPVAKSTAEAAERYPCEGCACGCSTASHCWSSCCCHTLPQRLAWARREGVRPPETALDDAERAGLDVRDWRSRPRLPVCVTTQPVEEPEDPDALPPCCRRAKLAAACCASGGCPSEQTPTRDPRPEPGVALLKAMACQGLANAWLSLGEAPIPRAVEPFVIELSAPAYTRVAPLAGRTLEAPTPPPPEPLGLVVSS